MLDISLGTTVTKSKDKDPLREVEIRVVVERLIWKQVIRAKKTNCC